MPFNKHFSESISAAITPEENLSYKELVENKIKKCIKQNSLARTDLFFNNKHFSESISATITPEKNLSYKELVENADKKVYQAKFTGKNRFAF